MTLSKKTQAAVAKYGREKCLQAAKLHAQGEGASTIGIYLGLKTNQADAAINAGEELAKAPKQYRAVVTTPAGYVFRQLLPHEWDTEADAMKYARVMVSAEATVEAA